MKKTSEKYIGGLVAMLLGMTAIASFAFVCFTVSENERAVISRNKADAECAAIYECIGAVLESGGGNDTLAELSLLVEISDLPDNAKAKLRSAAVDAKSGNSSRLRELYSNLTSEISERNGGFFECLVNCLESSGKTPLADISDLYGGASVLPSNIHRRRLSAIVEKKSEDIISANVKYRNAYLSGDVPCAVSYISNAYLLTGVKRSSHSEVFAPFGLSAVCDDLGDVVFHSSNLVSVLMGKPAELSVDGILRKHDICIIGFEDKGSGMGVNVGVSTVTNRIVFVSVFDDM